jgi:aryl-alcohol dehydrogenase-like predicted oxidoreductase
MLRTLPNGRQISCIGFGCSSIWAKSRFPTETADEILDSAYRHGINHFDTSPSYGWGESEHRLGSFIKRQSPEHLVVSTKLGTFKSQTGRHVKNFSPVVMERSLTESLARLGIERIQILYLHGPSLRDFNEDVFRFFENEKSRGRIEYSGVNSFDRTIISSPLDVIMLQYNVADLSAADLFDDIVAKGKIIIAGTILAQGVTQTSTFRPKSWKQWWYLARAIKNAPLFVLKGYRISRTLASFGLATPSDPLRFVLSDARVLSGLFGTSNPEHVIQNAKAALMPLPENIRAALFARLSKL